MTTKYIRYFETTLADYNFLLEAYHGSKIKFRETKQNDAIRVEGPISAKAQIDSIVDRYELGGK